MSKYWFRPTVKYMIILCTPKIVIKKCFTFFSLSIRMSGKNVNFGHKKIKKKKLLQKQKSSQDRWHIDVNKILVSTEKPYGTKNSFK